ncbi:XRE family transcriptional regulator [Rhizocola hellebori]|uniref:XRE family transcriptional regulator n=1 Tax=Rhizocola hellebori TaxID=1392758 RepID=A0A8J3QGB0_9ACTN|nr:BTAD domain-containing putative transcriptional regulator [Rhizocola hellebori]GIH10006.1 XRE family transcriptional regulator [Rhizocola hellebori]
MEIRLLGPVEVLAGGQAVDIGKPQRRIVLAALAADADRLVTTTTLIRRVWGDHPSADPRASLRAHVSNLRRLFESQAGLGDPARLEGGGGGYVLRIGPQQVDIFQFRRFLREASQPGIAVPEQLALLRKAQSLWRGEPLAGLSGEWAQGIRESWRLQRLEAVLAWARAEIRDGHPAELIGPLSEIVADDPLQERAVAALMHALYAAGDEAQALQLFHTTSDRLADKLGSSPGTDLTKVHIGILKGELERPVSPPTATIAHRQSASASERVPAELPALTAGFVGRVSELARLDALLGKQTPATVVISAVAGAAGIGKTTLAICWAHRIADRFPDGQLYIDLRGFDTEEPLQPADVLAQFLVRLGIHDLPVELPARAARFRTRLAGKRMLVVLDNAANSEQVRPLLPGAGSCCVLVTSRDSLAGLVASQGAQRIDLDVLPHAEACHLLTELIGGRAQSSPQAVAALADQCGCLPLALRIAAERALSRPAMALADLVAELGDEQRRLDLLHADERTAISTVFSWSYRQLDPATARLFRLLGLHPGAAIDTYAAAALAGTNVHDTQQMIDTLRRGFLIQPVPPDHLGLHDLLRAYAVRLATIQETANDITAAATRLLDFYLAAAAEAMDLAMPGTRRQRPRNMVPSAELPAWLDADQAMEWLTTERQTLIDVILYAARHGFPQHATRFGAVMFAYLLWRNDHLADALVVYEAALHSARQLGDRASEAAALLSLGRLYHSRWGRLHDALDLHRQAQAIMRQLGDHHGADLMAGSLGAVHLSLGQTREAAEHLQHAHRAALGKGDRWAQAIQLVNIAMLDRLHGRYSAALIGLRRCVTMFDELGDRTMAGGALMNLAEVLSLQGLHDEALRQAEYAQALRKGTSRIGEGMAATTTAVILGRLGQHEKALRHCEDALAIHEEHGYVLGQAYALDGMGRQYLATGCAEQAVTRHRQALAIFRERSMWIDQTATLNHLGAALPAAGQQAEALQCHREAIDMARTSGDLFQQAKGLHGTAMILDRLGDQQQAQRQLGKAIAICARLGFPDPHQAILR